jgi:hypothetical protein
VREISASRTAYFHGPAYAEQTYSIRSSVPWIMHGIRELCATQKTSFVNVLSVELRNSRLSLSSSHIGIRDDSGFAKVSVAVRRLLSSVTLPVNQHSLPPAGGKASCETAEIGGALRSRQSRVESFVLRRGGHPRRSWMRSSNVVRTFASFQRVSRSGKNTASSRRRSS